MNQYPGFLPMMVPQPYMVAMPAIPLPPGVPQQHAHAGLQPMIHPPVAAAHAAAAAAAAVTGAPAVSSAGPGVVAPVVTLPLTVQNQMNAATATMENRKRQHPDNERGNSFPGRGLQGGVRGGPRWQTDPELDVDEPSFDESACVLDHFNSDLHLVIDPDGHGASTMNDPPGFCFTWAGARATYGSCRGKAFYEVHITENTPAEFGDDHQETDPHVVRVGWSIDSSSFQLGEEPWSFGYGGTGKFSTNNKFSNYGAPFGVGDVIGAMIDLDARPATISFMKNGNWFGVAVPLHGYPVGSRDMALFPHVLSKNCRFKVNFGQLDPWFPPPPGFQYIGHYQVAERVRGMLPPSRKADCEMIMIVGLPGAGKTTWGVNMQKNHPEKRYNIIGTDTLIEKMRVMGLPRRRNYHGRWEVLIEKATKCLNKLFQTASRRRRNYILDQTNVYASARRRKMKSFNGFYRIAAVLQPDDSELERRSHKRTVEDGKYVPETAVLEMKANFSLPEERDKICDRIDFIELPYDASLSLIQQYNKEGNEKRPPPEVVFRHDNRFSRGNENQQDQQSGRPGDHVLPPGTPPKPLLPPGGQIQTDHSRGQGPRGYRSYDQDLPAKRSRGESGSALDFIKQEYGGGEEEQPAPTQWPPREAGAVKEKPHWEQSQYGGRAGLFESGGGKLPSAGDAGQPNSAAMLPSGFGQSFPQDQRPEQLNQRSFAAPPPPPPPTSQASVPPAPTYDFQGGQVWQGYNQGQQNWPGRGEQGGWGQIPPAPQQQQQQQQQPQPPPPATSQNFNYSHGQQTANAGFGGPESLDRPSAPNSGGSSFRGHNFSSDNSVDNRSGAGYGAAPYGQSAAWSQGYPNDNQNDRRSQGHPPPGPEKAQPGAGGERPRRRKTKWDTPGENVQNNTQDLPQGQSWQQVQVKREPEVDISEQNQSSWEPPLPPQHMQTQPQQQQQGFGWQGMPPSNPSGGMDAPKPLNQFDFSKPPPGGSWMGGREPPSDTQDRNSDFGSKSGDDFGSSFDSSSGSFSSDHHRSSPGSQGPPRGSFQPPPHPGSAQRPPFQPRHPSQGGNRFPHGPGPNNPREQGGFGQGLRQFRPRNPNSNFGGPPGGGGGGGQWNQNHRPRFGPRGPGGRHPPPQRFDSGSGPRFRGPPGGQRWPRPR